MIFASHTQINGKLRIKRFQPVNLRPHHRKIAAFHTIGQMTRTMVCNSETRKPCRDGRLHVVLNRSFAMRKGRMGVIIKRSSCTYLSSPIILTSGSNLTPNLSYTVFCTKCIKSMISVAVAPPLLMIKPLWRSETCAPPTVAPLSPAS